MTMKLSFEVESDSNETTNCSPSPHPEKDVDFLEEKSLHALAYGVKRTPVDLLDEGGRDAGDNNNSEDEADKNGSDSEVANQDGAVSVETLQEQYTALQQQMVMLQQQLPNQQQAPGMPMNLHMQQLQQQQQVLMQQQMLMQMQNPAMMAMMMSQQQPMMYGMGYPMATMQVPNDSAGGVVPATQGDEDKQGYYEQTDMGVQHTPGSPKTNAKHSDSETETSPTQQREKMVEDSKLPFKMLRSGGSSQAKGKSLKYSSYLVSAKREFAKKEAQKSVNPTPPPQAAVAPNVVETTEQRQVHFATGGDDILKASAESDKSKVIDEKYPPEAVVQPMPKVVVPEHVEAPQVVAPESVENAISDDDTDHDAANSTSTSTNSHTASEVDTAFNTSNESDTPNVVTETDTTTSTTTNKPPSSIPQARVPPLVATKPASRGPARRITIKTDRDKEVAQISNAGNVNKFRQVGCRG